MKFNMTIVVLLLISVCAQANLSQLEGQLYRTLNQEFSGIKELGGGCMFNCSYAVSQVSYSGGNKIGLVLSKKFAGAKNWQVVDILEDIKLSQGEYIQSYNCVKQFSKVRERLEQNPMLTFSQDNIIAFVTYPASFSSHMDYWVETNRVYEINKENNEFRLIPAKDIYCDVGIG